MHKKFVHNRDHHHLVPLSPGFFCGIFQGLEVEGLRLKWQLREGCPNGHVFITHSGNSKHRMAKVKGGLETQKGERDCWKDIKTRPWKGLC